jgi:hypothetical protein
MIAGKIGHPQSWVSRQLLFGRFLKIAARQFLESLPKPLTEMRFRCNYSAAGKQKKDSEECHALMR